MPRVHIPIYDLTWPHRGLGDATATLPGTPDPPMGVVQGLQAWLSPATAWGDLTGAFASGFPPTHRLPYLAGVAAVPLVGLAIAASMFGGTKRRRR